MIEYNRFFGMPNADTFSIPPIKTFIEKYVKPELVVVDPFARNSRYAQLSNDLNPATTARWHLPAESFVEKFPAGCVDIAIFDPPYSPRQIAEVYQQIGKPCSTQDTQNARLYKRVKDGLDNMLKPGGIALCFGWNSMGFGVKRGYSLIEVLLVPHGAAHNDTICTAERKL